MNSNYPKIHRSSHSRFQQRLNIMSILDSIPDIMSNFMVDSNPTYPLKVASNLYSSLHQRFFKQFISEVPYIQRLSLCSVVRFYPSLYNTILIPEDSIKLLFNHSFFKAIQFWILSWVSLNS